MHEVVRSSFHIPRIPRSLNLAGRGLPERMRSTAFAFLGLTAAAGLTLVAIFAQLNFPLLSPAPLPSEPSQEGSVAKAVALERRPQAAVPSQDGRNVVTPRLSVAGAGDGQPAPAEAGHDAAGGVDSPSPVSAPQVKEDGASPGPAVTPPPISTSPPSPARTEDPTPAVQPDPAPVSGGSSKPKVKSAKSKPVSKPDKTVAKPSKPARSKPEKTNSKPTAKAESKAAVPAGKSEPEAAAPPPPPPDEKGGGKEKENSGKALGHDK